MSGKFPDDRFDFEKLEVYQLALDFLDQLCDLARTLSPDFRFTMGGQILRAGLSISNNIAEGTGKRSKKEKARYYSIALDSTRECISMLNVFLRQKVIGANLHLALRQRGRRLTGMLSGLIASLDRAPYTVHGEQNAGESRIDL